MLTCHACSRQRVRTVLGSLLDTSSFRSLTLPVRPSVGSAWLPLWLRRSYALTPALVQSADLKHGSVSMGLFSEHKQRAIADSEVFSKQSLEQELRYLRDPLKLARYVLSLLQKDENRKATELVKMASKQFECTVSWNHLVDHEMGKGRVSSALKLYNDMKKRAQKPDAQTFTILFRGLSWYPEYPHSLGRALSIYQSMFAENCPVRPSIIHTNAVLRVCSRFKDTDAMFGIAAKLPTHGPGAANALTFTTILNAIRTTAWEGIRDDKPDGKAERRRRATMQGRRMWDEIIGRWRKGDIKMDEDLVCAMGRLLLLGESTNDYNDVFALVEQTMGIKYESPPMNRRNSQAISNEPNTKAINNFAKKALAPADNLFPDAAKCSDEFSQESGGFSDVLCKEPSDESSYETPGGEFTPFTDPNLKKSPHTQPGRNTLSMVMDACLRLCATSLAQDYWGLLTDSRGPYNINPDAENYHAYMRLLRQQRASKLCVGIVTEMRNGLGAIGSTLALAPKTFRIALSTCVRDCNNPNALENASKLVHIMMETLSTPDVKALSMYLHVATHRQNREWKSLMTVLKMTTQGFKNLRSRLAYAGAKLGTTDSRLEQQEMVSLATRLIGAYDIAVNLGWESMSKPERAECHEQRNALSAWITRINNMSRGKIRATEALKDKEKEEAPAKTASTPTFAPHRASVPNETDPYYSNSASFVSHQTSSSLEEPLHQPSRRSFLGRDHKRPFMLERRNSSMACLKFPRSRDGGIPRSRTREEFKVGTEMGMVRKAMKNDRQRWGEEERW